MQMQQYLARHTVRHCSDKCNDKIYKTRTVKPMLAISRRTAGSGFRAYWNKISFTMQNGVPTAARVHAVHM